jgi:hypothetical protein
LKNPTVVLNTCSRTYWLDSLDDGAEMPFTNLHPGLRITCQNKSSVQSYWMSTRIIAIWYDVVTGVASGKMTKLEKFQIGHP